MLLTNCLLQSQWGHGVKSFMLKSLLKSLEAEETAVKGFCLHLSPMELFPKELAELQGER